MKTQHKPINPDERLHLDVAIIIEWACKYCDGMNIRVEVTEKLKKNITTNFKQTRSYTKLTQAREWAKQYSEAVQMMFPTAVISTHEVMPGMQPIKNLPVIK